MERDVRLVSSVEDDVSSTGASARTVISAAVDGFNDVSSGVSLPRNTGTMRRDSEAKPSSLKVMA
jgi:hypothetical protein